MLTSVAPNQRFEILLVLHAVDTAPVDAMSYPIGFFESTYGSLADDTLDEVRDDLPPLRDATE